MNTGVYWRDSAFASASILMHPHRNALHSLTRPPRARTSRRVALTVLYCVLGFALCTTAGIAGAADLRVTVQTPTGQPASGANVCAGTAQSPAQYATAKTAASGVAVLRNVPAGSVQVTAQSGGNGQALVHQMGAGSQQSIVIRLPVAPNARSCGRPQSQGIVTNPRLGPSQPAEPTPRPQIDKAQLPTRQLQRIAPDRISTKTEYCFGALGAQCGLPQVGLPTTALCAMGRCQINAGSWEHDECCFAHPGGMACKSGPLDYATGHSGHCVNEWNKALSRLSAGLNWMRPIDFNRPNSTGRVEFSQYCAQTGTRVHPDDVRYCCSRNAEPMPPEYGAIFSQFRLCK